MSGVVMDSYSALDDNGGEVDNSNAFCNERIADFGWRSGLDSASFRRNGANSPPRYVETDMSSQQDRGERHGKSSERREEKPRSETVWGRRLLRAFSGACAVEKEAVDSLKEGADVHWLNSLGGTTCLLVDSYRDLCDGVAIEEAFSLVQPTRYWDHAPFDPGTHPTDRVERALADVVETRGRSSVPPRLLQVGFPQKLCRGNPTACGDLVAFLKIIHAESETMIPDDPTPAPTTRNGLPKSVQSHRLPMRSGAVTTHPSSDLHWGLPIATSPAGAITAGFDEGKSSTRAARSMRRGNTPAAATTGASEVPSRAKAMNYRRRYCRPDYDGKGRIVSNSLSVRGRLASAKVRRGITAKHQRDDGSLVLSSSPWTKYSNVVQKKDEIRRRKNGQTAMASGVGTKSSGRKASEARESSAAHERPRRTSGTTAAVVAEQAGRNRVRRDEGVLFCRDIGMAIPAGRSSRRRILRWMDRLGLKVDWSLLTPEDARCHENLSNGKLLCELAAAADYALSGGRGLPLSEIPSQPGRFVLRGTCGEPSNAARSSHNVRTALGAFQSLGGISGFWLRDEQAILDGDHAATWGLLGAVYARYGRLHPIRQCPERRARSLPHKSGSLANTDAASIAKISPLRLEGEPDKAVCPDSGDGRGNDKEAGNIVWRAWNKNKATMNVRKGLSRDLAGSNVRVSASSNGKLLPNENKREVKEVATVKGERLRGTSELNTRVEPPESAVTPESAPAADESAPGLRKCNKSTLPLEGKSTPDELSMMMPCGTETACLRVIGTNSSEPQREEKIFKDPQQRVAKNEQERRDSRRSGADKVLVNEIDLDLVSSPPPICRTGVSSGEKSSRGCQRSFHGSVPHRKGSSPTTDALGAKTSTSEEKSQRSRCDHVRGDKELRYGQSQRRVAAPNVKHHQGEMNAGQAHHASVSGCKTPKIPSGRRRHEILLDDDWQIAPWAPPPPPTSPTLRRSDTMPRTNNAIIVPLIVPLAGKEHEGEAGRRGCSIGERSGTEVRCGRRREGSLVTAGAIITGATIRRPLSPYDFSLTMTPALAGLEGAELFLSVGGLPPSELPASRAMPQDPFSRSPGFDLLPL